MNKRHVRIALALAAGLALALVWQSIPLILPPSARAAEWPVLSRPEGPVPSEVEGTTRYVAPDGDDANDCATVADRCRSIQRAVDVAGAGDLVLVAAGTYTGVRNVPSLNTDSFTATQVVVITETIAVRGGYTTDNWTTPDFDANPTTVDAQGAGRVLYVTGDISPTVEGLRITGGNATGLGGDPWGWDGGGGVYISRVPAVISNCVIHGNTASTAGWGSGGGMFVAYSYATVRGNAFVSNTATTADRGSGGGLNLRGGGGLVVDNTVVSNTASSAEAGNGGGVCLRHSHATLSGNLIAGNWASTASTGYGGGVYLEKSPGVLGANTVRGNVASTDGLGYGGGLYVLQSEATLSGNLVVSNTAAIAATGYGGGVSVDSSEVTLTGNSVRDNTASTASTGYGGGVCLTNSGDAELSRNRIEGNRATTAAEIANGGGIRASSSPNLTLVGNWLHANVASTGAKGRGGAVYLSDCEHARLSANTIVSNAASLEPTADGDGGGVYVAGHGPFTMTNNVVAGNHANNEGGGLYFGGPSGARLFGSLLHTTIANNASDAGLDAVLVHSRVTLAFTDTIISGHGATGLWVNNANSVTLEATLWYGNGEDIHADGGVVTSTMNVYGDPDFVDPTAFNYHIGSDSAAIDAGIDTGVTVDIDDDPRPVGAAPDIGADEFRLYHVYLPLITRN